MATEQVGVQFRELKIMSYEVASAFATKTIKKEEQGQ